jgi:pimeloyl-ACP methyl ester carboxylesterase
MARAVLRRLVALRLGPVVIVGHSLGALVAMRLADAPELQVRGVMLVEGGPSMDAASAESITNAVLTMPRSYASVADYVAQLMSYLPLAEDHILAKLAPHMLRQAHSGGFELKSNLPLLSTLEFDDQETLVSLLRPMRCPCCVVRGAWSSMLSRDTAKRIAALAPRGSMREVRSAGHAIPLENPTALAAVAREFVTEVESVPP